MSHSAEQLHALVAACEQFRSSEAPDGYRDGLALCVIDSVQSTGVTYSSVENVVARYRAYRREQGGDPNRDGAVELLATFDELDGPEGWAKKIGNSNRTSTRGGVLKSEAIRDAARVLDAAGIGDTAGLRQEAEDVALLEQVRKAWCAVKGQRSGITWHYMQMLACIPGVKPDRMICRFVADSFGAAPSQCHAAVCAGDPDRRGERDRHVADRSRPLCVAVPAEPEVELRFGQSDAPRRRSRNWGGGHVDRSATVLSVAGGRSVTRVLSGLVAVGPPPLPPRLSSGQAPDRERLANLGPRRLCESIF